MAQQLKSRGQASTKGLYVSAMGDMIPPEYTPWCQNVRFRFGEVLRAPGRSEILDSLTGRNILDFATVTDAAGNPTIMALCANGVENSAIALNIPGFTFNDLVDVPLENSEIDQRFSWAQGEERLFVTRGYSEPVWIQTSPTLSWGLLNKGVDTPTAPGCSFLEYFANRVFAMNLRGKPSDIQWSAIGDYTDWDTVLPHGGFLSLYDGAVTRITGGKVLGDRLMVYREDAISSLINSGDPNFPFPVENRVNGIGCLFPWTLQSAGQFHLFLGNDYMVYMWDGVQLHPIGQPVHSYIRRLAENVSAPWYQAPFAALFKGFKEYYLVMQAIDMNYREVLIYDYMRGTWTRDYFDITPSKPFGSLFEIISEGPTTTLGFDGTNYPNRYPMLLASCDNELFVIDERILGDRLSSHFGGMDMWWDTIDMYYSEDSLVNGTCQRVITSQKNPLTIPQDPPYYVEVIVDRGANVAASTKVTPSIDHVGFEFADFNVTSNVRRYRFHYKPEDGPARPTWRGWSDIYVPCGDFFPISRTVTNPVVPPIGTD